MVLQCLPVMKVVGEMLMSLVNEFNCQLSPHVEDTGLLSCVKGADKAKATKVAHKHGKKPNLLDHINFFPSKEEGRIPGERKALSETQTKRVSTSVQ